MKQRSRKRGAPSRATPANDPPSLLADEVFGLFPVPVLRARAVLNATLVDALIAHFAQRASIDNNASNNLSHTEMLRPDDSPLFVEVAERVTPKLIEFGALLLGERLAWALKEMWVNVLEYGGRQAMHTHANSFISGVLYLTASHPESQTMFMKSPGGTDFIFRNEHAGTTPNEFCADKWRSPLTQAGDLILFPSYLLHAVPPNQGQTRITLAFNAMPSRLESWGYVVKFSD